MKKQLPIIAFLLLINCVSAQEVTKDSVANPLQEVVVTGQLEPQSIRKSVFNVNKITRKDIERQAANNLSDLLNQYLNITITPSSGTGRSTVSMFGLDGQYFKILIDNIPVVSDNSVGNNVDLTQINLDDIEQIEIIEGSMGVTHGANAVSGILNIITKKSSMHKWEITTTLQEETVGEEYAMFNKGRHIQALKVSHTLSENWFVSLGFNRNDFSGYLDQRKGKDYTDTDLKRGFTWLPKQQYLGNATINYNKGNFRAYYKFDYLNENINYYNPSVIVTIIPPFEAERFAYDKRYITERLYNHLNLDGRFLGQLHYNVSFSYQKQTRNTDDFKYDLNTKSESENKKTENQSTEILYSTGTVTNFFKDKMADLQLGYEIINNKGFAIVDGENQTSVPITKTFNNYDFFAASEIKVTNAFWVRPGARFSLQSQFDNQYAASLGFRYLLENNIELRTSLGKSYRTPDFEELYSKIKFSGHNFYGNENLIPETSTSYDFNIKRTSILGEGKKLYNAISLAYLDVNDKIDMALVGFAEGTTDPVYQYINISSYKMWNIASNNQFEYNNWSLQAGASLVGISRVIDNGEAVSDDKFLYGFQVNANVSYNFSKQDLQFSVYYKYNGEQQQFVATTENDEAVYKLSEIGSYSFLDASVKKSFFKRQFDATIGARNIFDVTNIQQGIATGGAHTATTDILLGYGRSYFLKLTYNLNF
ncbi:TonB-dependent receptor plug domain-containing protein [Flavobacterium sp. 3HN19-14]|uniref:TonB-dependent receptor plug domain-containing protein n=1 Tax=Flavobacterium sp. 3HN19-14 TaxID=3448133 RepID=UPI003EE3BE30